MRRSSSKSASTAAAEEAAARSFEGADLLLSRPSAMSQLFLFSFLNRLKNSVPVGAATQFQGAQLEMGKRTLQELGREDVWGLRV